MLKIIELDYSRYSNRLGGIFQYLIYSMKNAGFRAVLLYRLAYWLRSKKINFLIGIIERVMHHSCHCWISTSAEIGSGFLIAHVGGLVIGGKTKIGNNCDVRQNVTFGGNYNKLGLDGQSQPWVGDNVSLGVGAVIIGPIKIGSNVIVGANTVVNRDVPDNVIVFGVPGKIVKEFWTEESNRKL